MSLFGAKSRGERKRAVQSLGPYLVLWRRRLRARPVMSAGPVEPAHSAQNRTHSSVDLGNWLLYYMARLAVGVSPLARSPQFFFPQLPYVRRSGFMHIMSNPHANPNVTRLLSCLPGVSSPLRIDSVPLAVRTFDFANGSMPGLSFAGERHSATPFGLGLCCMHESDAAAIDGSQAIGSWALHTALECYGSAAGPTSTSELVNHSIRPAVLHVRCGDIPFKREPGKHMLRFSGWIEMIRRVRPSLPNAPLRIITCYSHEKLTRDEKLTPGTESGYAAGCTAFVSALQEELYQQAGLNSTLHVCEQDATTDFVEIARAPVVFSSGSTTFSFVAGFFGTAGARAKFQTGPAVYESMQGRVRYAKHCAACETYDWMLPAQHVLLHAEVPNYMSTPAVLDAMRATTPPPGIMFSSTASETSSMRRLSQRPIDHEVEAESVCVVSLQVESPQQQRSSGDIYTSGQTPRDLWANKLRFCAANSYRCLLHDISPNTTRHPSWNKVLLVQQAIERSSCDWALWADADVIFTGFAPLPIAAVRSSGASVAFATAATGLSAGVFLARADQFAGELLQGAWDKGLNSHLRWTKFPWEQAAFIAMLKSSPKLCSRVVLLPFLVHYPQGRVHPSAPANSCTLSRCPWSSSNRGYPLPLFHATGSARLRTGHERLDWITKALIAANRTMTPKAGIYFKEAAEDHVGSVGRHHQLQCSPESVHAWSPPPPLPPSPLVSPPPPPVAMLDAPIVTPNYTASGRTAHAIELAQAELRSIASRVYAAGDKISCTKPCHHPHSYEQVYAAHLAPMRLMPIKFLEVGLGCDMRYGPGLSLQLWLEYLPRAEVWTAEVDEKCVRAKRDAITAAGAGRVGVLVGDQGSDQVLRRWRAQSGGGFDFIIDDGGHHAEQQFVSLTTMWHWLNPGGVMVVEDMGMSRHPDYRHRPGTLPTNSFMSTTTALISDLVEFGSKGPRKWLPKRGVHPSTLFHLHLLPRMKSVACFAETCAFTKCTSDEEKVDSLSACNANGTVKS